MKKTLPDPRDPRRPRRRGVRKSTDEEVKLFRKGPESNAGLGWYHHGRDPVQEERGTQTMDREGGDPEELDFDD